MARERLKDEKGLCWFCDDEMDGFVSEVLDSRYRHDHKHILAALKVLMVKCYQEGFEKGWHEAERTIQEYYD